MIVFDTEVLAGCNAEFGVSVLYQPASGGTEFALLGIFTDGYKTPGFNEVGAVQWNTTAPTFGVRSADLPAAPAKNDKITANGQLYIVVDTRRAGLSSR